MTMLMADLADTSNLVSFPAQFTADADVDADVDASTFTCLISYIDKMDDNLEHEL